MTKLAIFASGEGTNAENLIISFQNHESIRVCLIVCNKLKAPVLEKARNHKVSSLIINSDDWKQPEGIVEALKKNEIDFIVLAGFLWLIPRELVDAFPNAILNIHPALLPKYGGKGMYGKYVHEAIYRNKETETGITIHFVNQNYDEGQTVFQKSFNIDPGKDTSDMIAQKVSALEYEYYPKVIEKVILERAEKE